MIDSPDMPLGPSTAGAMLGNIIVKLHLGPYERATLFPIVRTFVGRIIPDKNKGICISR